MHRNQLPRQHWLCQTCSNELKVNGNQYQFDRCYRMVNRLLPMTVMEKPLYTYTLNMSWPWATLSEDWRDRETERTSDRSKSGDSIAVTATSGRNQMQDEEKLDDAHPIFQCIQIGHALLKSHKNFETVEPTRDWIPTLIHFVQKWATIFFAQSLCHLPSFVVQRNKSRLSGKKVLFSFIGKLLFPPLTRNLVIRLHRKAP